MHILIIPSWYPADTADLSGSFFREQALALSSQGFKVGVVSPQFKAHLKNADGIQSGELISDDQGIATCRYFIARRIPLMRFINDAIWCHYGLKTFENYIEQHGKPDVIHAHCMLNGGNLAATISKRYDIPYIVTEHNSDYQRDCISRYQAGVATSVANNASALLAVSDSLTAYLNNHFSGGVQWEMMPNVLDQRFERAELSSNNEIDTFCLCSISNLTQNKGVDVAVKAFAKSFKGKPATLYIAGNGPEKDRLMSMVVALEINDQVEFLGAINRGEVVDLLNQCHAYVLSSYVETFGVVLIESLAMGKPVLATRSGGPESIVTTTNGILVDAGDIEALASAMKAMRENYHSYDRQAIREACLAKYSQAAIAGKLKGVYERILYDK